MRKKIKGICLALAVCLSASCFSACFEKSNFAEDFIFYDYEMYKEQVVSIELIDYTPENVQYLLYSESVTKNDVYETFETEKATVIEVLPDDKLQTFLYDLSVEEIHAPLQERTWFNFTNPCGRSARITYQDGTFHVISYCEIAYIHDGFEYTYNEILLTYYDSNGTVINSRFVENEWYIFVMANYFDAKVYPLAHLVEREEVTRWDV